jgi:hypothetical protein
VIEDDVGVSLVSVSVWILAEDTLNITSNLLCFGAQRLIDHPLLSGRQYVDCRIIFLMSEHASLGPNLLSGSRMPLNCEAHNHLQYRLPAAPRHNFTTFLPPPPPPPSIPHRTHKTWWISRDSPSHHNGAIPVLSVFHKTGKYHRGMVIKSEYIQGTVTPGLLGNRPRSFEKSHLETPRTSHSKKSVTALKVLLKNTVQSHHLCKWQV